MTKTLLLGIPVHLLGVIAFVLLVLVYLSIQFVRTVEDMIRRE